MTKKLTVAFIILCAGMIPYILWYHEARFLSPFIGWLPNEITYDGSLPERFLRFHFSDIAWYAALLIAQDGFSSSRTTPLTYIIYLLPFIAEGAQYLKLMPGTADPLDIIFYSLTFITYIAWKRKNSH